MKQILMSKTNIRKVLGNIPNDTDMNVALCNVKNHQQCGVGRWDFCESARAIIAYYHRRANENWDRARRCLKGFNANGTYAKRARKWTQRAMAVEDILLRMEADELNGTQEA